jgi:hypothetical protein
MAGAGVDVQRHVVSDLKMCQENGVTIPNSVST